jgi:hypothetical protein
MRFYADRTHIIAVILCNVLQMLHDLCPPHDRCVTLPLELEGEGGRDREGGREGGGMAAFVSVN